MKSIVYILEPITNLHVGNGDINYNIIDNEEERDPLTRYPIINSSGVKGAFRQFIQNNKVNRDVEINIFGSEPIEQNKDEKKKPGKLKFYSAECLAITMRNEVGKAPYSLVTTKKMLQRFIEMCEIMQVECNLNIESLDENKSYKAENKDVTVEEIKIEKKLEDQIKNLFTKFDSVTANNLVVIPHDNIINISLPVVARNVLEDGISKNIWYEEYVPHHSLFFVCVSSEEDDELLDEFNTIVENKIVQFGGNATIGYGLTKVKVFARGGDDNVKE